MPARTENEQHSFLLVALAQSGDRAALDRLLRDIQEPLYRHVLSVLRDADLSKDVLQDVLFIVSRKLSLVRDPRWFRAWAFRIATREAVRRARRENKRLDLVPGEDFWEQLDQPPAEDPPGDELLERLPELLDAVSRASGIVLRLHYVDGLTHVEIAEALEISVGTVKSRLAYGLASLRRLLGVKRVPQENS